MMKKFLFLVVSVFIFSAILVFRNNVIDTYMINDNTYFLSKYGIDETLLNLKKISFGEAINIEKNIDEKNSILYISREQCGDSKKLLRELVKLYNEEKYTFGKIYVYEVDGFEDDNQKELFLDKFKTNSTPTLVIYKVNRIYSIDIGYFSNEILKEVLDDFQERK